MKTRNTVQRSLVLEAVKKLQCHATADEIYDMIVQRHPDISRGTIYRNLLLLSETGKIRKILMPNGADRYDHQCHEHYHARCTKCGRILDVDIAYLSNLEAQIENPDGFEFTGHDIIFKGICPQCRHSE